LLQKKGEIASFSSSFPMLECDQIVGSPGAVLNSRSLESWMSALEMTKLKDRRLSSSDFVELSYYLGYLILDLFIYIEK
jgi:hypothetical protein